MTRRDDHLDALIRHLGAAYYQALHGDGSAAEVRKAVARVAETAHDAATDSPSAAAAGVAAAGPQTRHDGADLRAGRWRVKDVMTTGVVSVSRDASYRQIAQLLHSRRLTALPVLDAGGSVAGVVSEADLLRKQERHERTGRRPGWQLHPATRAKAGGRTAAELMTSPAVTITPDALLGRAARLLSKYHVKRLPVVDGDGKLIGIISRGDLLAVFLRPDDEIAAEAKAVLTDVLLADPQAVSVSARDGVITLSGRLASAELIDAAVRLTEEIDGVVAVTSKLHAPPPEDWPGAGYHVPA